MRRLRSLSFDALRRMRDHFDRTHGAVRKPQSTGEGDQQHQQTAKEE